MNPAGKNEDVEKDGLCQKKTVFFLLSAFSRDREICPQR